MIISPGRFASGRVYSVDEVVVGVVCIPPIASRCGVCPWTDALSLLVDPAVRRYISSLVLCLLRVFPIVFRLDQ